MFNLSLSEKSNPEIKFENKKFSTHYTNSDVPSKYIKKII